LDRDPVRALKGEWPHLDRIRAKKVLELSLRESKQLGHNYIGTEHILLGLIREGDRRRGRLPGGEGVAAQVLARLGADLNNVRMQVIQVLTGDADSEELAVRAPFPDSDRTDEILALLRDIVERLERI
jgi:ATP-dependent Clp protease ATP-binding subunit ClpC